MATHGNDLLAGGLGAKTQGSGESSNPTQKTHEQNNMATSGNAVKESNDLIAQAAGTGKTTQEESKEPAKGASTQSSSSDSSVSDPDSWTLESALKEMKKTREEAKATRIKYQEMVKANQEETKVAIEAERAKASEALNAQKELEEMKAKEADKKRTLEERLSHREKLLAEHDARITAMDRDYKKQLEAASTKIKDLEAVQEAQLAVYKDRLNEELAKIPADRREFADLLVKGAGDSRDALIALNEAKLKGLFEDKKVVVSHAVPGANTGARVNQQQLEDSEKDRRKAMNPRQKISEGLKGVRKSPGSGNNKIL